MDDVITTIVYLIPIAAILFIRVFAAKKRAQAKEKQLRDAEAPRRILEHSRGAKESEGAGRPLSRVSGRETEEEWKPHWIEEDEEETPPARPASAGSGPARPAPTVPARSAPFGAGGLASVLSEPPEAKRTDLRPEPRNATPIAVEGAHTPAANSGGTFPASVERLSPLKKALVLSEVLGKPRAFEEGDRRF